MDSDDDSANNENVRRTRSGKIVRLPQAVKTPTRKSKRKAALMELSEEEELVKDEAETEPTEYEELQLLMEPESIEEVEEVDHQSNGDDIFGEADEEDDDVEGQEVVLETDEQIVEYTDEVIEETDEVVEETDEVVEELDEVVEELDEVLEEQDEVVEEQDDVVEDPDEVVEKRDELGEESDEAMEEPDDIGVLKKRFEDTDVSMADIPQEEDDDVGIEEKPENDELSNDGSTDGEVARFKREAQHETHDEPTSGTENLEHDRKEDSPIDQETNMLEEDSNHKNGLDDLSSDGEAPKPKTRSESDEGQQQGEPDAENISEDELPQVQAAKVPETEEVSDEELPGPRRAELPADTEVVSEDELPTVKKEATKRKLEEGGYDPGSPTSEGETPAKKQSVDVPVVKEEDKTKPKKLPELDKYWKAVNDDPSDFTGWTYLLQYVDQENDMEAAREAYDAFLSHYPYCYGYWRKYADYEKRKGNKKKCEEVFERGLKAIPLSVDLWIHYLTYVKTSKPDEEEYIRSQFERAIAASGLEFRSDRLWDSYMKWEMEARRLQHVTSIYDRLFTTPTQGYTAHFEAFQEHISANPPNKVVEVDEFLALRKEVRNMLKHDVTTETKPDNADAPPGEDDSAKTISSDEETKAIRERIISIRRKIHKGTVAAVTARWNFEEGIKRPYFHVKPLERCQLKNWQEYLDYEIEQGDQVRIVVLFERCLIACALYEEFWLKFVHYLESLKDAELQSKIRDVYERACTIHHLKKPSLHLQWAMFEESVENYGRAAEILVNLEKSVPNLLQIAYRRINLERRKGDNEKCAQLYEHYINNSKNKLISSNIAIKYSRFCAKLLGEVERAVEILKTAIAKDPNNPRLYLQLIDLTLQRDDCTEGLVVELIDSFLEKESADADQKVLFAQRKLEYLEDFGSDIQAVQSAYEDYQKYIKQSKDSGKKKEGKNDSSSSGKKDKSSTQPASQSGSYGNYSSYGNAAAQNSYQYSGSQAGQYNYSYGQGDQYQYQGWQYPQGSYGGYNQWGSYGGGYSY